MEDREILGWLNACGFRGEPRERYLALARAGRTEAQIRLLWRQRGLLMERLHTVQKQVDRIDFMLCALERKP